MSVDLLPHTRTVAATALAVPIAAIPVGNGPTGIALSRVGRTGYVTNFASGTVTALDTATRTATATITVGSGPWGVAVDPTGAEAYVGNAGSGTVSVIATATNAVTATIGGISAPAGIAFSTDAARAYVVSQDTGTLIVLDTATRTVVTSVEVGSTPYEIALSPDIPHAYVSDFGGGTVTVVNTGTLTVIATIGGFTQPRGLAVTPDGQRLYVTDHGSGTVSVVDTTTYTVAKTIGGFNAPVCVAMGPRGVLAYVTEDGSGSLTAINLGTNTRASTVAGLSNPDGLAVTPDSHHIYVADTGSDTVRLLNIPVAVSPDQGPSGGGTPVILTGRGFLHATQVRFGGRPATSFTVVDDTIITALTPAGSGAVPVTVTIAGASYSIGTYFYLEPPRIRTVSPTAGPNAGGNTLTITGIGLYTTEEVRLGTTSVYPTVVSDARLVLTAPPAPPAPPGPAIRVPVVVTTLGGVASGRVYTYLDPATTTTLSSSPELPVVGERVRFTAAVATVVPGAGTPTGTVWFDFGDGTVPVNVVVVDGLATAAHTYTSTANSPYMVTAGYRGDNDFAPSSDAAQQAVAQAPTSTTVLSSPEPSSPDGPVSVTTRVIVAAPGTGRPTGTVTIDFGDGTPTVVQPLVDGLATVTHTYPASEATYTITAFYSGDTDYASSTDVHTHRVLANVRATTTSVASSPDASTAWQPVTFTATVAPVLPEAGTPTGTVTFDFGDGTPTVPVALADGVAVVSHTYTTATGSPYPVTAFYTSDNAELSSSVGYDTQTVNPAPTSTAVGSSAEPSLPGEPVTFTATVTPHAAGADAPAGTVSFDFGDGTARVAAPVEDGTAVITHAYATTVGSPYTVTAAYDGDADFAGSADTAAHTVDQASTSVAVASVPDPSVVGEPVAFTATVAPLAPGAGTPTGTVTFGFGDGTTSVTLPLTGAAATTDHTYTSATGSPYPVTVTYDGDTDFTGSTGAALHTVNRAFTTTAVASVPDPSVVGEPVAFTATVAPVTPGAGTPTGTVTFGFGDGTTPVTVLLTDGSATATHTYTGRSDGPEAVTATFDESVDFVPSTGAALHTVNRAFTTTAVASVPDPSVVGEPVAFTATVAPVTPGAGTPTGTVTFNFGDGTTPVAAPLAGGTATVTRPYTDRRDGPYTITATYSGDTRFADSTGTALHTVDRASTSTAVVSAPDPSVVGELVTFTATVTPAAPGAGTPTGTVTFGFGDGTTPVAATLADGTATVTHAYATRADSPYTITATYHESMAFAGSTGTDTHTVGQASTTTTLVSVPDPSVVGQPVTFTATVAPLAPGAGTPTGTVAFQFGDGTTSVTAPLAGGTATVTRPYTTRTGTPYTVNATYNASPDFAGSTGTDTHAVNRASTKTTVTSAPDPSVVGQPVTFTATVAPLAPGAGTPTGTVAFQFGDGTTSVTAPLASGTATVTRPYTARSSGLFTVTATYLGSTSFAGSSRTDPHTVDRALSTTTVVSSPDPSTPGQAMTVTATVTAVPPGAGTPTGSVTFAVANRSPVTSSLVNGSATTTVSTPLSVGTHSITATYIGSTDYTGSSGTDNHTVTP
ncbi:Ig-like domain repeat protein [Streptomyces sp. TRM68367]|uniref:Ig-like domain repeat protein n=1 Tax=Streptomyces sp. TRM68367 TaxID=2758415 RepID=UPI00165C8012|nr:Ig-like domain repeat protein [Streptomyces sp. TRM68367]MBC9726967.1 Ig-like domain repeat protein [Streptomyces sp. TRM68367]